MPFAEHKPQQRPQQEPQLGESPEQGSERARIAIERDGDTNARRRSNQQQCQQGATFAGRCACRAENCALAHGCHIIRETAGARPYTPAPGLAIALVKGRKSRDVSERIVLPTRWEAGQIDVANAMPWIAGNRVQNWRGVSSSKAELIQNRHQIQRAGFGKPAILVACFAGSLNSLCKYRLLPFSGPQC